MKIAKEDLKKYLGKKIHWSGWALAEIADSLLSTNDADVITKKRENFKKVLEEAVNHWAYKDPKYLNIDSLVELIVQKTFDESVVN